VTATGTRYRLLETVRQYAAERLVRRGDHVAQAARRAHRDVFLALAETAQPELHGPDQRQWLHRLQRDVDNLRAALIYSVDDPDGAEHGVRLAVALRMFRWRNLKLHDELTDALTRLVDSPALSAPVRVDALYVLSDLAIVTSTRQAENYADAARALTRELGDPRRTAFVLLSLTDIAESRGDYCSALRDSNEALNLALECNDGYLIRKAFFSKGWVHLSLGQQTEADEALAQALENARAAGDHYTQCCLLLSLGASELAAGRYSQARKLFEDGESSSEASGAARLSGIPFYLGLADFGLAHYHSARRFFHQSMEIDQASGELDGFALDLLAAALSASQLGRHPEAVQLHGAADHLCAEIGTAPSGPVEDWRNEDLSALRGNLEPLEFDRYYEQGQRLTRPQAVALAADVLTS
jgi:tetratricopeptide (TPR) repeat protein